MWFCLPRYIANMYKWLTKPTHTHTSLKEKNLIFYGFSLFINGMNDSHSLLEIDSSVALNCVFFMTAWFCSLATAFVKIVMVNSHTQAYYTLTLTNWFLLRYCFHYKFPLEIPLMKSSRYMKNIFIHFINPMCSFIYFKVKDICTYFNFVKN